MVAPRKPKDEGISTWYERFGPLGAPAEGQRGYVPEPCPGVMEEASFLFGRALQLLDDPDVGPWVGAFWALAGIQEAYDMVPEEMMGADAWGDAPFTPNEFSSLIGAGWLTPYETADVLWAANNSESRNGGVPDSVVAEVFADAICAHRTEGDPSKKLRLVIVPKSETEGFIRRHHSKLPNWNYRGLLYTIGIRVGYRLVAVAAVTCPSGQWKGRGAACTIDGVVELSRIASDGSVLGASSKLAARAIDLLPVSGRRGAPGCLLVTYSLKDEPGTTYLALADKGLRPVAYNRGKKDPGGSRHSAGEQALPQLDKVMWEAGPAARPPDWDVLGSRGLATPERLAGAARALAAFEQRTR